MLIFYVVVTSKEAALQLTIVITQDDLAKLSQSTIEELLSLATGAKSENKQSSKDHNRAEPIIPSALAAQTPSIVPRKSRGTVSMGQVFDTIRQNPGKTTEELVSMMYSSDIAHRVAMNRCQSHITRLIKGGEVERVWEEAEDGSSRLYAKDKKRSHR